MKEIIKIKITLILSLLQTLNSFDLSLLQGKWYGAMIDKQSEYFNPLTTNLVLSISPEDNSILDMKYNYQVNKIGLIFSQKLKLLDSYKYGALFSVVANDQSQNLKEFKDKYVEILDTDFKEYVLLQRFIKNKKNLTFEIYSRKPEINRVILEVLKLKLKKEEDISNEEPIFLHQVDVAEQKKEQENVIISQNRFESLVSLIN